MLEYNCLSVCVNRRWALPPDQHLFGPIGPKTLCYNTRTKTKNPRLCDLLLSPSDVTTRARSPSILFQFMSQQRQGVKFVFTYFSLWIQKIGQASGSKKPRKHSSIAWWKFFVIKNFYAWKRRNLIKFWFKKKFPDTQESFWILWKVKGDSWKLSEHSR